MNSESFSAMVALLNAGGRDYTVFLQAYDVQSSIDLPAEDVVTKALGHDVVITDVRRVSPALVDAEVRESLTYPGDDYSGPDPAVVNSERFRKLLEDAMNDIGVAMSGAQEVKRFEFLEGHPAYPVFWDFGFLFSGPISSVVLIGSSSD